MKGITVAQPIVKLINDSKEGLKSFAIELKNNDKENELINDYPTVYIHNWKKNDKYEAYVGESNKFFQRTAQHYELINDDSAWQHNIKNDAGLYVIAHEDFNKSLTLDIENKLIQYLSSSESVRKVYNARSNPQGKYYPDYELEKIFNKVWRQLRKHNKDLFLTEAEIRDSAIYKASPLHKLNEEQLKAKATILEKINFCLLNDEENQLVFVEGDAGTGKTVLMSSLFYELKNQIEFSLMDDDVIQKEIETAIIVNHNEQYTTYKSIVEKLDLADKGSNVVFNPTTFINLFVDKKNSPKKRDKSFDVVFVDEAHLLLTQKNQSFTEDSNQLTEIIKHAKVVVVMFDRKQIMNAQQYLSKDEINGFIDKAKANDTYITLSTQMRIMANRETCAWIKNIFENKTIGEFPLNTEGYEIKVFDSPKKLHEAIKEKASEKETALSRLVATYDWDYGEKHESNIVTIGDWSLPWNYEGLKKINDSKYKRSIRNLAWQEQPHTIDEVGSTYTIQGFDLSYAGVILGPSITYRDGRIKIDPSKSKNDRATHQRTLKDGTKQSFGEEFINNELGVLLTRGVKGLYLYACDKELQECLKKVISNK